MSAVASARHGRVELFSDAVFAVAITLLVLDLRVPDTSGSLAAALADRWPAFAAFGISFVIVGCIWVNHSKVFASVQHVDTAMLFLNLALLMCVVLVPFGTSLLASYVTKANAQSHIAAAIFSAIMFLMGLAFNALHLRAARFHAAAPHSGSPTVATLSFAVGPAANGLGIGLAFLNPVAVLALFGGVAVYYLVQELVTA
jgi:uncharacterized membrane protein